MFFNKATEAEDAGYRPCKRCRPELVSYNPDEDMIELVRQAIERTPPSGPLPSLETLARVAGLTQNHFHRKFRRATGLTPRAYAMAYLQSKQSLSKEGNSIIECSATISPFTVSDDGEGTKSNDIFWSLAKTNFGYLSIAFLEGKICHLELAPTAGEADQALRYSFDEPHYRIRTLEDASCAGIHTLQQHVEQITEALERPSGKMLDLPFSAAYITK